MQYCPECGGELPEVQARYCPACGDDLSAYRTETAGRGSRRSSDGRAEANGRADQGAEADGRADEGSETDGRADEGSETAGTEDDQRGDRVDDAGTDTDPTGSAGNGTATPADRGGDEQSPASGADVAGPERDASTAGPDRESSDEPRHGVDSAGDQRRDVDADGSSTPPGDRGASTVDDSPTGTGAGEPAASRRDDRSAAVGTGAGGSRGAGPGGQDVGTGESGSGGAGPGEHRASGPIDPRTAGTGGQQTTDADGWQSASADAGERQSASTGGPTPGGPVDAGDAPGSAPGSMGTAAGAGGASLADRVRSLPFGTGAVAGAATFLGAYVLVYVGFVVDRLVIQGSNAGLDAFAPTNTTTLTVGVSAVEVATWKLVGWLLYGGLTVPLETAAGSTVAVFDLTDVSGSVTPLFYAGIAGLAVVGGGVWLVARADATVGGRSLVDAAAAGATVAVGFVPLALAGTFLVETGNVGPTLQSAGIYAAEFGLVGGAVGGLVAAVSGLADDAGTGAGGTTAPPPDAGGPR